MKPAELRIGESVRDDRSESAYGGDDMGFG